jgi:RHS repeat-associated protein
MGSRIYKTPPRCRPILTFLPKAGAQPQAQRQQKCLCCIFRNRRSPYGENYDKAGPADLSFTGQNQDTTPDIYDFMYRRYSPVQGRWISPDPAGLAAVDPTNPQSWNRYAYVMNSPLNSIDPLGFGTCSDGTYSACVTASSDNVPTTGACYNVYVDDIYWGNTCAGHGRRGSDQDVRINSERRGGSGNASDPKQAGKSRAQWDCGIAVAKQSSLAGAFGVSEVPVLGDLLGNQAADAAELATNIYDLFKQSGEKQFAAGAAIIVNKGTGYFAEQIKGFIKTDIGFRNKSLAKAISKGFGSRTNLFKVMAKTLGYAKMGGDAIVFGGAFYVSCAAVGE